MKITIETGESIKSPRDGKQLLPQLVVTSSMNIGVFGLYDNKPNFLGLKKQDSLSIATFFLHENITAHINTGYFNIFITNTRYFIGCLICSGKTLFKTMQEIVPTGESEERICDTHLHDFIIIRDEQMTTIEPFRPDKETDKHVRI